MKKKLILVDGSSYLFRAYYALPLLTNTKGQHTGAILGVINMLKKLMTTYNPTWMVVVFDSKEPTFRHKLFSEYKINRSKIPEELASQISYLIDIIKSLGIYVLQIPGIEADDIIGTLVNKVKSDDIFTIIATGDKDLAQLVNDDVVLINTMTDLVLDPKGVLTKFNVPPNKIIDYLVLIGDQVDNIPGVKNVGPKTAAKWLEYYKDLNGIIAHSQEIKGKVGENLREAIKKFSLYIKLITIDQNIELKIDLEDFLIKPKKYCQLKELFTELEFYSWLKELELQNNLQPDHINLLPAEHAQSCTEQLSKLSLDQQLSCWINIIKESKIFAIHFTTESKDSLYPEITGIHLATNDKFGYIKLQHFKELISSVKLNRDQHIEKYSQANNLSKLIALLKDPDKTKITYNLKNLLQILDNYGIIIEPIFYDVMLEAYVINSVTKTNLDLGSITAKQILDLHNFLFPQILQSNKLINILNNIEIPLSIILKNMERTGVLIDQIKLSKQSKIISKKLKLLAKNIYRLVGKGFNLNSPKQLQEILYNKLKLPVLSKTPTGQFSTSEEVLQELAINFELPKLILNYRSLSKLQTTYIDKLPKAVNYKTGRIHTTYNQTITTTGRLSSSDPNLQNIPIKTAEGRRIREAFIARAGYKILSADYSQIELRILAHLSEDPGLINAFKKNIDIHSVTASEIFQVNLDQVTSELRRKAKAINFGLIYGMSDFGLAKQLKIAKTEAATYIKTYFAKFPNVLQFMENTKKFAIANGFVETMFGRRLYLPDINNKNSIKRKTSERAAINAPMQGGQADLIKLAMIKVNNWIENEAPDIFMLMQVHDELVFEVPDNLKSLSHKKSNKDLNFNHTTDKIEEAKYKITKIMQEVVSLKVELKVDIGIGNNWGEAHPG